MVVGVGFAQVVAVAAIGLEGECAVSAFDAYTCAAGWHGGGLRQADRDGRGIACRGVADQQLCAGTNAGDREQRLVAYIGVGVVIQHIAFQRRHNELGGGGASASTGQAEIGRGVQLHEHHQDQPFARRKAGGVGEGHRVVGARGEVQRADTIVWVITGDGKQHQRERIPAGRVSVRDARRARQREDIRVTTVKIEKNLGGVGCGEPSGHGGFHGIGNGQGLAANVINGYRRVVHAGDLDGQRGGVGGTAGVGHHIAEAVGGANALSQRGVAFARGIQRVGVAAVGVDDQGAVAAVDA